MHKIVFNSLLRKKIINSLEMKMVIIRMDNCKKILINKMAY